MDYYKVNTDPTKSPTEEFADLVDFYQSGGQQDESKKAAPEAPEAPVSRRPSEPVRNTPPTSSEPASNPPKKPASKKPGLLDSFKRGFKEGVDKAKGERSVSDEKKTGGVASSQETSEKKGPSGILQRADEVVLSGVQTIDRFLRRNG